MAKLDDVVKDPAYAGAASASSKASLLVFIATFAFLVFFSGRAPGFVQAALFFFVGTFAVPLLITMPLFLLRAKIPRFGPAVSVADIAITILLTRALYLWLFDVPVVEPQNAEQPFVVACREPIPEFTLGRNSNPSDTAVSRLCSCIWNKFDSTMQDASRAIAQSHETQVLAINKDAFASQFGASVKACGGMDL